MILSTPPGPAEAPEYYFKYISLVPNGDILRILDEQRGDFVSLLRGYSEEQSRFRYAPDKWSVREVVAHINDAERLFAFRAFWFARGFTSGLPGFDQMVAAQHTNADERALSSHVDEFESVRASTLDLLRHLSPDAWLRTGVASDCPFTARALAYIAAGHVIHHAAILKERYVRR